MPNKKKDSFAPHEKNGTQSWIETITTPGSDTEGGEEAHGLDDDDGAAIANTSAEAILRDFRYKLQCMYMEPSRDLRVLVIDFH